MPDDLILIFFLIGEFEIAFECFCEDHLHGADHASPSIIALNFLDALAVGEPEDVSIDEQKLVGKFCVVAMAEQLGIGPIVSYLYFFALDERDD